MTYAVRANVEQIFGKDNVKKWADIENSRVSADIDAQVTWALDQANVDIDARLLGGPYSIPFVEPPEALITNIAARRAGINLYDSRQIEDTDDENKDGLTRHRNAVDSVIRAILAGTARLAIPTVSKSYPEVVE